MQYKLFYFLLGCKPKGRNTEQHDIFFTIAEKIGDTISTLKSFWPDGERLHIDCWREVTNVNGHKIKILLKSELSYSENQASLFFINLGGYKRDEFNEFHSFELFVAANQEEAIRLSKKTIFYKQNTIKGAVSHIDDKYGIDVDDIYEVNDIISQADKAKYRIIVTNEIAEQVDELHLGYTPLSKLR